MKLNRISFFGRSFCEYCAFFDITQEQLSGQRILDVAAGPSAFTADLSRLGNDATACDPMYRLPATALYHHATADHRNMFQQVRNMEHRMLRTTFPDIACAEADRMAAVLSFLADYAAYRPHGRYISAALPDLPFAANSFDRVFCAHLLFSYEQQLDYDFHCAAIDELLRVARQEVRIHPIVNLSGTLSPFIPRLMQYLQSKGHRPSVIPVRYGFFPGSDQTLIIRPKFSFPSTHYLSP